MSRSEKMSPGAVGSNQLGALRIECYVRSDMPAVLGDTTTTVINRLQTLSDGGIIADYEVKQWPAERHLSPGTNGPTRETLVADFERWAEQHGSTLAPAFRREVISGSPLGIGNTDPRERVRVPFLALALYADDPEAETEDLRGVVPYTDHPDTDTERTYTVDEWVSAVEMMEGETPTHTSQSDQTARLEGQQ